MEKPPVVVRLMDQMKRMAELQQTFEAAGKLMSKADKVKIMNVEKNKLDALKQEQLQEEAAPQAGAVGDGEEPRWGPVLAAAGARKTRSDYVDYPCSQLGSDPNILEHCSYTNFTTGREAVHPAEHALWRRGPHQGEHDHTHGWTCWRRWGAKPRQAGLGV